jgi:ABC-2 type transport system ATP-binding protein
VIEVRGLRKTFGDVVAVDDLSFSVPAGEIFGFLGPNGAGKTTTIRMLTCLAKPTSGTATVAGFDILTQPLEAKRRLGYLAENPYLYLKLSGREFLDFLGDLYGVPRVNAAARADRLLDLFELSDRATDLIEGYSHGMRQKLALAGTLLHEPRVLFLDEPTSALDPRSARRVKDLLSGLARDGRTILLTTHVLEIAEAMCDRVGIINRGRLIALGTMDELRARSGRDSLEDVFLELTGGAEVEEVASFLREGR